MRLALANWLNRKSIPTRAYHSDSAWMGLPTSTPTGVVWKPCCWPTRSRLMNRMQFQPGLSWPAFLKQCGAETPCAAALERARWPEGFRCPHGGEASHSVLGQRGCKTFQRQNGRVQTALIAGTLFQSTPLALTLWFLAIYPAPLPTRLELRNSGVQEI